MSKISLAPDASGTGIFTIASPGTNTNRTLTLPDDTGTIVTNSGNQAGSFTTLNTSGQVVFNDAGADVDFRVEGDTDANLLFVDAGNDRVGIGTNTPDALLNVDGIASFGAGSASTPSIAAAGDLNTGTFFPAADTIAFAEGGAEAMRIDSSGNVLVGTTTAAGTIANSKPIVGGRFRSFNGSLSSIPTGTPTTMFTMTAAFTTYLVTVSGLVSSVSYSETAIIHLNNTGVSVTIIADGGIVVIDNSGLDVRFTQNSGITMGDMIFSVMRIL